MEQQPKKGISLRTIHIWLIVGAVLIAALMIFVTFHLSNSFKHLTETSEQQIELRNAARELMDASDYLTEKVQRFTIKGDRKFMDEYFTEAFETNRREEAIDTMSKEIGGSEALAQLQQAMQGSLTLMNQEYYAMRLVIEAKGITDYPDLLKDVTLSPEDQMLTSDEKMQLATEKVLNDDYYALKDEIRADMKASLDELEKMAYDTDASALHELQTEMVLVRIVIAIQTIGIFFMVWLTSRLGIHPIMNAVSRIKSDSPIPEVGANEFRYLARAYNKMYNVYKRSLERLNFKASHDELTGAYNRAGYDLLLSSLDLNTTYMILCDMDNFKGINDTYGHDAGDKALIRLVQVLKNNFRSDDYVCRIGGDEFIVFMVHSTDQQEHLIASKIEDINRELAKPEDGFPGTSISVGIVHGTQVPNVDALFEKADEAMYKAKQSGKNTYTFYKKTEE